MTSQPSSLETSSCSRSCQCSTQMVSLWATTVQVLQLLTSIDNGQCLVTNITLRSMPPKPWSSRPWTQDVSLSSATSMVTHATRTCSCMAVTTKMRRSGCVNESSHFYSISDSTVLTLTHVTSMFRRAKRVQHVLWCGNVSHWSMHSHLKAHSWVQVVDSTRIVTSTLHCSERWASNSVSHSLILLTEIRRSSTKLIVSCMPCSQSRLTQKMVVLSVISEADLMRIHTEIANVVKASNSHHSKLISWWMRKTRWWLPKRCQNKARKWLVNLRIEAQVLVWSKDSHELIQLHEIKELKRERFYMM